MDKILVSACLLGDNVKYNGGNNYQPLIEKLKNKYEIISICPEVMGGLSIPRNPSEISNNKVINNIGIDVTKEYIAGANKALRIAFDNNIKIAILKEGSPSCGSNYIYDGSFSHVKIDGSGVTAKLLRENGIKVYSENEIDELL